MSGFPSLHLCIWMYGYLNPADLCSCICSRVCTCESLFVWLYMKQCVCRYLWMCTVLPLACISGCVCMCVVLDRSSSVLSRCLSRVQELHPLTWGPPTQRGTRVTIILWRSHRMGCEDGILFIHSTQNTELAPSPGRGSSREETGDQAAPAVLPPG